MATKRGLLPSKIMLYGIRVRAEIARIISYRLTAPLVKRKSDLDKSHHKMPNYNREIVEKRINYQLLCVCYN